MAGNSSTEAPHGPHSNATEGEHGGGGGGHKGGKENNAAMFALRQIVNERTMKYYAAALCGIMAIFIILHWSRFLVTRSRTSSCPPTRPFILATRRIRNLLVRGAKGFNSAGHGLLTAVYVGINLVMILVNVDLSSPGHVASRLGCVLISNMCFVVFLALKNTPLAFLTAYSYERLNNLHQIAGCTTFLLLVLHAAIYTGFFMASGRSNILREEEQIAGIVAGFSMLVIALSGVVVRRYAYETFKAMHILSFISLIVATAFHRPDFHKKMSIVTCLTGAMFAADWILRLTRFLINGVNNEVTVYPLASGGTRILFAKAPAFAAPGKHCFVWIPKIRKFETHPFTVIATGPLEFMAKSYDGFTRDLHAYAEAHPGAKLRASLEGPYGTFPDPMDYDTVVLIAGGSGATYTFGLAVNLLERMNEQSVKKIVFIWTAKSHENLTWFKEHLATLRTHPHSPKVHVSLYVTRLPGSSSSSERGNGDVLTPMSPMSPTGPLSPDPEKSMQGALGDADKARPARSPVLGDIEKEMILESQQHASGHDSHTDLSSTAVHRHHAVSSGRPDVRTLVRAAVAETPASHRVLVAACGPEGLMKMVRNTAAQCIKGDGPGIELHCEQFGW